MRIVLDARVAGPEMPGIARATLGLLEGLVATPHDAHVTVLHHARHRARLEELALDRDERFALLPVELPANGLRRQQQLRHLAARIPHDSWHAAHLARPLVGTGPAVVAAYDLIRPRGGIRRSIGRAAAAAVSLHTAAHVVAPSQSTARALCRRLRLPAQRVSVVPLAAAPRFRPCDTAEVRRRYDLRVPYVMHLATNQPHKNAPALVDAWRRMGARGDTAIDGTAAQLVLAGHVDPTRPAAPEADGVRRLGAVPEADLPPLLAGAAAFAFPSLDEGFGLPALEAMAAGTAVVAARRGALPEVVGDAGMLVEPTVEGISAGLARVLGDGALRTRLAHAGRTRASRFSWQRTAEQTLAIHRALAR